MEEILHSARPVSPRHTNVLCRRADALADPSLGLAPMPRPGNAFMQSTHPGLQCSVAGQASAGYQLSREALLVGTVAALQEESGQMRQEWKTDVARLESELQQLRSAAAMALPHVRTESVLPPEANFRLMSNAPATDTCSNISGRDAASLHGVPADRIMIGRNLPQQSHTLFNHGLQNSTYVDVNSLESLLAERNAGGLLTREAAQHSLESLLAERNAGPGLLTREAAQLEAAMLQGSVRERAGRDHLVEVPSMQRPKPESQGTNLAEAVLSQMRNVAMEPQPARGSTDREYNITKETPNQNSQIKDLYMELERMTVALQESEQENNRLKEEKETSINAHARDIAALEAMLQQLSADNKQLSTQLAEANTKLRQLQMDGLDPDIIMKIKQQCWNGPSTPTSIRSDSIEPANEPDIDHSIELDKLKFKVGLHS